MNPESLALFVANIHPAFEAEDPTHDLKAVERKNVECIRGLYEALSTGGGAPFPSLLADDVELTIAGPPTVFMTGSWKGRDEVLQAAATNFAKLDDQKPEMLSITAQGDQVAVVARERGRVRESGEDYDVHWLQLYTMRDGRIARIFEFCDNPAAFA